jgi:hypothetical protein
VFERTNRRAYLAGALLVSLACLAHRGEWDELDQRLDTARRIVDELAMVELDLGVAAELGAVAATAGGEPRRAAAAYRVALDQWRRLNEPARVARTEAALAALEV